MGFLEKCREVGEGILGFEDVLVVHHYDCDGLSAAALVCKAVETRKTISARKVDDQLVEKISAVKHDCVVFADIGSGQRGCVEERVDNAFFLDHHPPQKKGGKQANVHDYGFDGAFDACGASTAYHCFKHTGKDLGRLGITGAIGDRQEPFAGFNELMLKECIERGEVIVTPGLTIQGRITKTLAGMLKGMVEPGELQKNGFDPKARYYEIPAKERIRLDAYLKKKLGKNFFGNAYVFPNQPDREETRDAHELGALLDACGRAGEARKGIRAAIRGGDALADARKILAEQNAKLAAAFREAESVDLGCFDFYDGRGKVEPTQVGIIAGKLVKKKPFIAFAGTNEVKVSARGTHELVEKGLDLGEVMRKAGKAAGGGGGGHNIAAGASFPRGGAQPFLKKAREVIEIQLQLRKV